MNRLIAGAGFGALYVVLFGTALVVEGATAGATGPELREHFLDDGERARAIVAFFLFVLSALAFVGFVGALRTVLAAGEDVPRPLTPVAFGAGLVAAALHVAGYALWAAPALVDQDVLSFDPNVLVVFDQAAYATWFSGTMVAAGLVFCAGLLAPRTIFPAWFGQMSFVTAAICLAAVLFYPIFALLAWVLLTSGIMLGFRRQPVRR